MVMTLRRLLQLLAVAMVTTMLRWHAVALTDEGDTTNQDDTSNGEDETRMMMVPRMMIIMVVIAGRTDMSTVLVLLAVVRFRLLDCVGLCT